MSKFRVKRAGHRPYAQPALPLTAAIQVLTQPKVIGIALNQDAGSGRTQVARRRRRQATLERPAGPNRRRLVMQAAAARSI